MRHALTNDERKRGGRTCATRHDMAARGRAGGAATLARHGREHLARIAPLGFQAFANRYCKGDATKARIVLSRQGLMAQDPAPENGAWTRPEYALEA